MKGLYIHIPFCKTICSYCDFPKIIAKKDIHYTYIDKLLEEIDSYDTYLNNIDTIYIGGGTPNSVELDLLEKLFIRLENLLCKTIENTIELNPELITEDLVILLSKYNFNRISLGVQTVNPKAIKLLNRHHSKENVINSIQLLRKYNINNINVDFIFGIPNTSISDLKADLDFILSLPITHISYYSLILEEKTVLMYHYNKNKLELLDDDIIADMYEYIYKCLIENGYHHYEISNFAKPGYESKHNLIYWNTFEYIGVGSGAAGYLNGYRYQNNRILNYYLKEIIEEKEFIDTSEAKKEFFMLGLRLIDGVSIDEYKNRFNSDPFIDFNLDDLIELNLLEFNNDIIKIKKDKLFVANLVFERFVGD